jgi:type II secretory pathway pseudopilin PulG
VKNYQNRAVLILISIISALALITVLTDNRSGSSELQIDSPEWVVQQYLQAMFDGDTDSAYSYLAPSSPCNVTHLDRAWTDQNASINLVEVETNVIAGDKNTARVEVAVEFGSSDLFSTPYVENHVYRLEESGESWLITGIPWPVYDCGVISK